MILEIINKKRLGQELSEEELKKIFNGYLNGEVADYQMSSLLMAICINGMSDEEIFSLTKIFIESGETLDFSNIPGIKVDKHSTGGIGDKTTLVIAPIVASLNIPVIKMSGRGLGYTGGTIDKLESIPGYRIDLNDQEIQKQVEEIGIVITGQTSNLVPMDKKIYALRDVTATVSSIPLIAASIMSKKIASGADKILIDIKVGKGALLQTMEEAEKLKDIMIKIGKFYNKEVRCMMSDMNVPLGRCIGNSLEVWEAMEVLQGREKDTNLGKLCYELAAEMVSMGLNVSKEEAMEKVKTNIENGLAYQKFVELVHHQQGKLEGIQFSKNQYQIKSPQTGVLTDINALELGKLSLLLGAGKENIEDVIDYTVGIYLHKLIGQEVSQGETLATLYYQNTLPDINIDNIFTITEKNV
ncbi:MAG: thymidine phosphorylase [Bacilli bacterium]|nr:thymidine phosphorylase [Bacilli bacterium]